MAVTITIRCNDHKTYRATRPPTNGCKGCEGLYEFVYATKSPASIKGIGGYTHDALGSLNHDTMYMYMHTGK